MSSFLRLCAINAAIATLIMVLAAIAINRPTPKFLFSIFAISLVYSFTIGLLCWWLIPRLLPRIRATAFLFWTQFLLLLATLGWAGGTAAFLVLKYQPFIRLNIAYKESMLPCVLFTLLIGSISAVVEQSRNQLEASSLALRTRELERERALKSAADARLQSLESRIHPHFLFNTLNSISSLVRSNPAQAEELIERLAALLRFSLDRHGNLVTLADEIKITTDYLEIEKARFGDRLRYTLDIPTNLLNTQVPALSLQTLAENSVKYAVGTQRQGADISIRAERIATSLQLAVTDSGPGFSPESLPQGHGLDTLKQRLEALYGDKAALTTRLLDPGMEVAFRIPC